MTPSSAETAWILPQQNRAASRSLSANLGVPGIVADVLIARGITAIPAAQEFLETRHRAFSDPMQLSDMHEAVARIQRARDSNEHVRVFGDYDVDGMAATALMVRGLRRAGLRRVSHAMPNRIAEGYGINPTSVAEAAREGVSLLITVDNGINAFDAADEARRLGVDLIVTDHHSLDERLPDALAVINPHRDDPDAAVAFCCGAAVAFKLCSALNGDDNDLDLAAIATVADVVPLRRENRLIVSRGVDRIAARAHPGIEALVRQANLTPREIRAEHIAFQLAPRLNASGRISDGRAALELMLTDSNGDAQRLALELDTLNKERRAIEEAIFNDARKRVEAEITDDHRTIVLAGTGWHPGVIGIVASKLMGAYGRPVMLIALDQNGLGRGSGRSTRDLHLADALNASQDLLVKHGGHRLAAGLTIDSTNVPVFAARLEEHARRHMSEKPTPRELAIDAVVALSELNSDLVNTLERLEPFGAENPAPVFGAFGVRIPRKSTQTLRGGHLRCTVAHESHSFTAIGFNLADSWAADAPEVADIAFRPRFNTWRGETSLQLQLVGMRPANGVA